MSNIAIYWDARCETEISDDLYTLLTAVVQETLIYHIAAATSKMNADVPYEVSISLVTREEIHALNRDYRGINMETDVLSFPAVLPPQTLPNVAAATSVDRVQALGDIVICVAVATSQAQEYGHSISRELAFLTAHGMLHLLGYDHENTLDEAAMIQVQDEILNKVGITR